MLIISRAEVMLSVLECLEAEVYGRKCVSKSHLNSRSLCSSDILKYNVNESSGKMLEWQLLRTDNSHFSFFQMQFCLKH